MTTQDKPTPETVSGFFERDHGEIDALFNAVAFESPREALAAFKEFDGRLERHNGCEEGILFPEVSRKAPHLELGPIRVMRLEHEAIRRNKAAALKALGEGDGASARSHAGAMVEILKEHNMKEERILYPACDELLSAAETQAVFRRIKSPAEPA